MQIPDEVIIRKIYVIRSCKVMLDRDLAELFGVETKRLKEAVRRNIERFPADFMFEMSAAELETWKREQQLDADDRMGLRYAPFCFTEQGVTMLSCVLSSDVAIQMNIRIIRIFTHMRELVLTHKEILMRLKELEEGYVNHSEQLQLLFDALKQLFTKPTSVMKPIGFQAAREE